MRKKIDFLDVTEQKKKQFLQRPLAELNLKGRAGVSHGMCSCPKKQKKFKIKFLCKK